MMIATINEILFWFSLVMILYTYFGYPLLITLMPARKTAPPKENRHPSPVTLLIAAFNEKDVIEEKIRNSLATEYPAGKLQILIVTDGSSDETPQIVESYYNAGVELLHQPERHGKMAAINRAMPHVRGDIIVFSDANNFYEPDTISRLVQPFSDPQIGAVSGAKRIIKGDGELGNSEGLYWKYESYIKEQESRAGSCTSVAGEILAIRKSAYIAPPDRIINDDFYTAMQIIRQGYRLVYVADARSSERVSSSARDERIRRTRINAGRYQAIAMAGSLLPKDAVLRWQIVSHKFLRPLVPFFMIIIFLTNVFAVLFPYSRPQGLLYHSYFSSIFLAAQILFYLLALVGTSIEKRNGKGGLARLLLYLPTFLVNSNYSALLGFIQYVKGQPGHLWQRAQRR
jgi:poly-beta-1,6-N-acetyl-D-glucosamine synthase